MLRRRWAAASNEGKITLARHAKIVFRLLVFIIVPINIILTMTLMVSFVQTKEENAESVDFDDNSQLQLAVFFSHGLPDVALGISSFLVGCAGSMWYFGVIAVIVPVLASLRADLCSLCADTVSGNIRGEQLRSRLGQLRAEARQFSESIALHQLFFTILGFTNFFMCVVAVILLQLDLAILVSTCTWAFMTGGTLAYLLFMAARVHSACSVQLLQACALRGIRGVDGGGAQSPGSQVDPQQRAPLEPRLLDDAKSAPEESFQQQVPTIAGVKDPEHAHGSLGRSDSPAPRVALPLQAAAGAEADKGHFGAPDHKALTSAVVTADEESSIASKALLTPVALTVAPFEPELLHWVDVVSREVGIHLGGVVLVTPPLLGTAASLCASVLVVLANSRDE